MIRIITATFLILIVSNPIVNAQCELEAKQKGTLNVNGANETVEFELSFSESCSMHNFGENECCGIYFPDIEAVWSGNTNDAISTITYTFSKPIYSIDIIIGVTGVNGSIALETFEFFTDEHEPNISVYSGDCEAWTIEGNKTTNPEQPHAFTSIHTISFSEGFTELTIITNSTGTGSGANGGSNFALCKGSVLLPLAEDSAKKVREAGG